MTESTRFTLRMPVALRQRLEDAARAQGRSAGELARRLIESSLAEASAGQVLQSAHPQGDAASGGLVALFRRELATREGRRELLKVLREAGVYVAG